MSIQYFIYHSPFLCLKVQFNYSNFQNDFAIIYDITEKGDYKLKVFDRSSYDIIYKDVRTTGIALIFIKDFDSLMGPK